MSQMRHTTMAEKYKGKYRIESNRLRGWDYSRNGHYFLTIVTAGRQIFFGNVNNGEMVLNEIGQIVHDEFIKSFEIRDELFMGPFVLMPNHLHAIVTLEKTECTGGHVEANGRLLYTTARHPNSNANPNPYHHLLQDSNRRQSIVLTIGLMRTDCQWKNSIAKIHYGRQIITTISSEMKLNTRTFPNTLQTIP